MTCACPPDKPGRYSLDLAGFRAAFPAFADPVAWPDEMLARVNGEAQCYISPCPGTRLRGDCLSLAIGYLTAHLLKLEEAVNTGSGSGLVSSASVDKVSISLTPPPVKNEFKWWLALTLYGQKLAALLKVKGGIIYVGGLPPERSAFRKAGGVFINGKSSA